MLEIIAEIGVNHDGDLEKAIRLTDAALSAGATAVKLQYFKSDELAYKDPPKTNYQQINEISNRSHREMLSSLEFDIRSHDTIKRHAHTIGLKFGTTIYSHHDVQKFNRFDLDFVKVASMDIVDHQLLSGCNSLGVPVIVSTGASTIQEVYDAARLIDYDKLCLMQCVSNYPASVEAQNLGVIATYKNISSRVGFSDHTITNLSAQLAIALGATVIEKHITLDKTSDGPDHSTSLAPAEFQDFTRSLSQAQQMIGSPLKNLQPEERNMRQVSRKSLYWSRDIEPGSYITEDDLFQSRPGDGLYSSHLAEIVGKISASDLKAGYLAKLGDVCG